VSMYLPSRPLSLLLAPPPPHTLCLCACVSMITWLVYLTL
jgi:hypothetical protein